MRPSSRHILRFFSSLGSHELTVLFALGTLALGVWMFAAIADEVMEGDTQAVDRKLLLAMRRPSDGSPLGPPWLQEAARDMTGLGGLTVLGLVTLLTAGYFRLDGKARMALFVCACVTSGVIATVVLKDVFHRARPELVPHSVYVSTLSFPSGHSMLSALTYLTLGALLARSHERKRIKLYFLLAAALLTFLVGVSRIYLGVHWPTDVLAGWTAGSVWAILCWLSARWLQSRHALEREEEHAPDLVR